MAPKHPLEVCHINIDAASLHLMNEYDKKKV